MNLFIRLNPLAKEFNYYQPIKFDELIPASVLEIRKYEDMPIRSTAPMGRVERKGDYIAHPFVPSVEFTPMGLFFTALAAQPQRCYVGISLSPTRMFDQEIHNASFAIGQFKKTATEDDDVTEEYIRSRSQIGIFVYQKLMEEREQLITVRVHLVGETETPHGLAEALGSELMDNANNKYPTQWVAVQPADDKEMARALNNLRYLEQDIWGHTLASPPQERLRYLATAPEAYGAFRLPVPPERVIWGWLIKSEPFVAPIRTGLRRSPAPTLMMIKRIAKEATPERRLGNGIIAENPTTISNKFERPFRHTYRRVYGQSKSTTIKHLAQLWGQWCAIFMLYPIDNPITELRVYLCAMIF